MNIARSTNQETRKRWAKELGTTVQTLHKAGIQWGDAKPDNILVDKNDDLWLIDFDGGYTRTWVSHDNCETEEGDLEGLDKIQVWLCNMG